MVNGQDIFTFGRLSVFTRRNLASTNADNETFFPTSQVITTKKSCVRVHLCVCVCVCVCLTLLDLVHVLLKCDYIYLQYLEIGVSVVILRIL